MYKRWSCCADLHVVTTTGPGDLRLVTEAIARADGLASAVEAEARRWEFSQSLTDTYKGNLFLATTSDAFYLPEHATALSGLDICLSRSSTVIIS